MRTMNQGTLDEILKFVNKFYQVNRIAPTISEVAEGVGVALAGSITATTGATLRNLSVDLYMIICQHNFLLHSVL